MNITLRQLEMFAAVAAHGRINQAADVLHVSASAISMALGELEQTLGRPLFDRFPRRLSLNDHGRALLPKARALLDQAREIEAGAFGDHPSAALRVGASTTIGSYHLPGILGRFATTAPGIHVQLEVANTAATAERLLAHEIDLALVEGLVSHPDLEEIPWRNDALVVFTSPRETSSDLHDAAWIMREPGSGTREIFEQAMRRAGLPIRVKLDLGHTEAIKHAVEAGLGWGCLSRVTIRRELAMGVLRLVPTPQLNLSRPLRFLIHRQKYRSEAIQRFMAFCLEDLGG